MAADTARAENTTPLPAWQYWVRRLLPRSELTPVRIATAYLLVGMAALFVSDVVLVRLLSEPLLSQVQAVKGGIEVVLTAGFIFAVTNRREAQLERHLERLDHQREELEVLHRVLRHNLRNDLCVVQEHVKRVRERLSSDRLDRECTEVLNTVHRISNYTAQASRIRRITDSPDETETVDLADRLPRLVDEHPLVTDDTTVRTTVLDRASVEVHPLFEEAIRELVENAIKHNDAEHPTVSVVVSPGTGAQHVLRLELSDDGPGIPASELEPLESGSERQIRHLSGMGLWFVKWTVRSSGGTVEFDVTRGEGTTVVIDVPKAPEMISSPLSVFNR